MSAASEAPSWWDAPIQQRFAGQIGEALEQLRLSLQAVEAALRQQ